jgi:hypothetical protein
MTTDVFNCVLWITARRRTAPSPCSCCFLDRLWKRLVHGTRTPSSTQCPSAVCFSTLVAARTANSNSLKRQCPATVTMTFPDRAEEISRDLRKQTIAGHVDNRESAPRSRRSFGPLTSSAPCPAPRINTKLGGLQVFWRCLMTLIM